MTGWKKTTCVRVKTMHITLARDRMRRELTNHHELKI